MNRTILLSCLILLISSCLLNNRQIEITTKSVNTKEREAEIEFLNVEQAKIAILDETYEAYFSVLEKREIQVLTNKRPECTDIESCRNFAKQQFKNAVISFTPEEKKIISFVISNVKRILFDNDLNLIANHPWKFIKIEDWLCGGYAHTRGDYIILSQRHIKHLSSKWSDKMTKSDSIQLIQNFGGLLVHEQFHSLQRQYPEKFELLYTQSWGFKKSVVEIDSFVLLNQLTNPDAPKPEWIVSNDNKDYLIRTLINPTVDNPKMGKDFVDLVFTLEKKNSLYFYSKDIAGDLIKQNLSELKFYLNSFPVNQGMDHPNEISAYMFSDFFKSLVDNKVPFANVSEKSKLFTEKYLTWLNNQFNTDK